MTILTAADTLFSPERAERLAAHLNATDEEGWTYRAVQTASARGLSYVEIRDEDGHIVGRL